MTMLAPTVCECGDVDCACPVRLTPLMNAHGCDCPWCEPTHVLPTERLR